MDRWVRGTESRASASMRLTLEPLPMGGERTGQAKLPASMLRWSRVPLFPLIDARERLTRGARPRQPEPMVMDEARGVCEYDQAGASTLLLAVHHFNAVALSELLPERGTLLDLGCGSARLLARLARGRPDAHLVGLDLSEPMLQAGRRLLARDAVPGAAFLHDGIASERAAFTFAELTDLVQRSGLQALQHSRAGGLGEFQLHWVAGREGGRAGRWYDIPLPPGSRLATRIIR